MKKLYSFLFLLFFLLSLNAQKDVGETASEYIVSKNDSTKKVWDIEGNLGLYASQVVFVNWSAGGLSSFSASLKGEANANYYKNKHSWDNDIKIVYGMILRQGEKISKNEDFFEINTKYGFQIDKKGKIFIGGLLKFKSQFSEGFLLGDSAYSTNFMAPGRLILAAGLSWKPKEYFSLFFSPAAGKFTFVTDKGVNGTDFGLNQGENTKTEFGAYLKMEFKKEVFKKLNVSSTFTLFNNFLDNSSDTVFVKGVQKIKSNRPNIDVDWSIGIDLVFSEWLTVNVSTQLIYDHEVKINLMEKDGITPVLDVNGIQKTGPRTQFTEAINIGLTYRFKPKEDKKP